MTPGVLKIIKAKGDAIRCESEMGEDKGHAGLIIMINDDKERVVIARTDPAFKSASAAVTVMKQTVDEIRNGKPETEVEEILKTVVLPPPEVKLEEPKKPRKPRRKPSKKKGE